MTAELQRYLQKFVHLNGQVESLQRKGNQITAEPGPINWQPLFDLYHVDGNLFIDIELPGVPEALVTVDATADLIVVKGTKLALSANPQCEEIFMARLFGDFSCHFAAPPGMTISDIDQRFENGVLHLKVGVLPGDPPGA